MSDIPVSIRLNPFKKCSIDHLEPDSVVPWSSWGRYLRQRPVFTLDPLFHAGSYYVQDASAMFVGEMFRKALSLTGASTVLDLCAAPGGKSTDAAASLRECRGGDFRLVSNEVIRQRSAVLSDNMAVWGDPNVMVTGSDPSAFSRCRSAFDVIIADVPCSGEGMFRKSGNARAMWSEDNVALCAARSRRIVADAWDALRPGGVLVFSTCTLNDEENDSNVRWIIGNLGADPVAVDMHFDGPEPTEYGFLLTPGKVRGEGQYCALLRKDGDGAARPFKPVGLNVIRDGVVPFTVKGHDRVPSPDYALSIGFDRSEYPCVEVDRQTALRFLHRDSLVLGDAPLGYVVLTYESLPLGFVKNLGPRANNLHPSSRRILMNVEL